MLLNFEDLPPGTTAETIHFGADHKSFTFYKLPEPMNQGPEVRRDAGGNQYMAYMWDFYLFVWPYGTGTVRVFHGSFEQHTKEPMWSFNIDKEWRQSTLVSKAKKWAAENDAQFSRRG